MASNENIYTYDHLPVKIIAGPDSRDRVALKVISGENEGRLFLVKKSSLKFSHGASFDVWWTGRHGTRFVIRETKPDGSATVLSIPEEHVGKLRARLAERK